MTEANVRQKQMNTEKHTNILRSMDASQGSESPPPSLPSPMQWFTSSLFGFIVVGSHGELR